MSRERQRRYNTLPLIAALFLFLFCPEAQALDPNKSITQYVQDVWKDELPQNTIQAITQTGEGYLWLGTYEGLVRFDGIRFVVFGKRSSKEIKSDGISALFEDKNGNLWIGTEGGLSCLHKGKFTTYTTKEGLSYNVVRAIYEDREGNIWIGTDRGLNQYRDGKFRGFTTKEGLSHDTVRAIQEDRAGGLWLGTDNGLSLLKGGKFTIFTTKNGLSDNAVRSLYEDRTGNIWIGTNGGGLCRYRDGTFTCFSTKDGLLSDLVGAIVEDRDGSLWIGTEGGGLNRLRDGKITSYAPKDGLSNNTVRSIFEDREGSLWVGTNGGLNRLRDGKFITYTKREGLSNDFVRTVCEDRRGNMWIGTDGGGLNRLADGKFTTYTTKDGLSSDLVRSVCEDREGSIWVGTNDGLCRFKDEKFTVYNTRNGLSSNYIRTIIEDSNGILWIGTDGGGVCSFKDGIFTSYTTSEGLLSNRVRAVFEDRKGNIWIGTNGGLNCLKDGKLTGYSTRDSLANDNIFAFYEDREGDLWLGTSGGVHRYRDGKFTVYSTKDGLFDDVAFRIFEDGKENLWFSCNKGIYRINKKDFYAFDRGEIKSIACTVFGKADGMGTNQCNGASQPAGWKCRNGSFWFPTANGLVILDPENYKLNRLPPPVTIEQVIIDNQPIALGENIELSAGREKFEFHYAGLSFLAPEKVRFKYRLEGFDKEWVEAGTRRTAYYTNIPPGNYKFRVIACNNDGVWNEAGASFGFQLPPPIYQTWWAYLLYILGIAGVGYGGARLRLQALRHRNEILEVKVAERTAELAKKNEELARKNQELVQSHKRADKIFSALSDILPGTVLDEKYRLENKIGSGGFGAVYKATHLIMKRPVAVKIFRPSAGNATAESLERFLLEAISTCRINHPNAVSVLDSGVSTEGIAYMVMELLEGHTLSAELERKGRLLPARAAEIVIPVCDVLSKAHAAGIVHRDIKPDNIFLHQTPEGEVVKVVDFGIAKLLDDVSSMEVNSLTAAGRMIGTPAYISPERLDDKPYDGRADVYSLGVMLYQMLCGHMPFHSVDGSFEALIYMHLMKPPRPLREFNPDIPTDLETVVMRALEKKPENRPTAKEFVQEFSTVLGIQLPEQSSANLKLAIEAQAMAAADTPTVVIEASNSTVIVSSNTVDQSKEER
jgi:ligand-binding sensor domain-containing protein/serine/threonine protein kinase